MKQTLGSVNTKFKKSNKSTLLSSYIDSFTLETFDEFVTNTKILLHLAPEALLAFDKFINTLNSFFSTIKKNLSIQDKVKWFKTCQIASGNYVHATSQHYNTSAFDNIAINMILEESDKNK